MLNNSIFQRILFDNDWKTKIGGASESRRVRQLEHSELKSFFSCFFHFFYDRADRSEGRMKKTQKYIFFKTRFKKPYPPPDLPYFLLAEMWKFFKKNMNKYSVLTPETRIVFCILFLLRASITPGFSIFVQENFFIEIALTTDVFVMKNVVCFLRNWR